MGGLQRLEGLDALRGMAALAVAVYHIVVLRDLALMQSAPILKQFYLAVPLFFVISAFSLCCGYFGRLGSRQDVGDFFWRRFFRIAPLFYFMIGLWTVTRGLIGWQSPSFGDILLSASFLFNLVPGEHYSIVPAGWSIGVEMLFYLAFPLLIVTIRSVIPAVCITAVLFLLAVHIGPWFAANVPKHYAWMSVVVQAPFFALGLLLFHIYRRLDGLNERMRQAIALVLLALPPVLCALIAMSGFAALFGGYSARHAVAASFAPLVLSFALYGFPLLVNRVTVFIGAVSYGIYLFHPWVNVVAGKPLQALLENASLSPMVTAVTLLVVCIGLSIGCASLTYYGFERRMTRYGADRIRSRRLAAAAGRE